MKSLCESTIFSLYLGKALHEQGIHTARSQLVKSVTGLEKTVKNAVKILASMNFYKWCILPIFTKLKHK